jgi:hypothetical protein
MTRNRILSLAIGSMAAALVLMLIGVLVPNPATLGLFLGAGLPLGLLGMGAFGVHVLRDLRRRGAL